MSHKSNCIYCGKEFERKHPKQKFCGKRKTGRHLCKDRFHNEKRSDVYWIHPYSDDAFNNA